MPSATEACHGCGKPLPASVLDDETDTVRSNFGWQLDDEIDAEGRVILRWRCRVCWSDFVRRAARSNRR